MEDVGETNNVDLVQRIVDRLDNFQDRLQTVLQFKPAWETGVTIVEEILQ